MNFTSLAIVMEAPGRVVMNRLPLDAPTDSDVIVDMEWSGISTGTERLFWSGRMPNFPGMGYPLVPGYESVGRIRQAGCRSGREVGQRVFVPGASCYGQVRGLFGGASSRVVVAGTRVVPLAEEANDSPEQGVLLALAATAQHALNLPGARAPELIIGHGALGRLLARLTVANGSVAPTVWERDPRRRQGDGNYRVVDPFSDSRKDYRSIYDVSGDAGLLDTLIARLAPGGEIILAGFYAQPLSFNFAQAFLREASIRVAAQWRPNDLQSVQELVQSGRLSLAGLISHRQQATQAEYAYQTAFTDPTCLKMVLDWRLCQ